MDEEIERTQKLIDDEVNKIIKRHKNLARFTTKDDKFFKQQIEIYEK